MRVSLKLLPFLLSLLVTGCFGDNDDDDDSFPPVGGPDPVTPSPENPSVSDGNNPFLNMQSQNYRLSARVTTVATAPVSNEKNRLTVNIVPTSSTQGERN
ncbi:hypothetical protein [Bacterioplanoides sp.]|uniref:hypothetical protein n=1 Tax=Bacterioplanoides sp. TaxID=2066072 RepID=UPI003B00E3B9